MKKTSKTIKDPDLAKVEDALKRAGQTARKIARDTGTPLVLYKDGKTILQYIEDDEKNQAANEYGE